MKFYKLNIEKFFPDKKINTGVALPISDYKKYGLNTTSGIAPVWTTGYWHLPFAIELQNSKTLGDYRNSFRFEYKDIHDWRGVPSGTNKIVINDKIKEIVSQFCIAPHAFYKAVVKYNEQNRNYSVLHISNFLDFLNYKESEFLLYNEKSKQCEKSYEKGEIYSGVHLIVIRNQASFDKPESLFSTRIKTARFNDYYDLLGIYGKFILSERVVLALKNSNTDINEYCRFKEFTDFKIEMPPLPQGMS